MNNPLVLTPAYGKTYKTSQDLLKAWSDGKDFKIFPRGPYTSCRDTNYIKTMGHDYIRFVTPNEMVGYDGGPVNEIHYQL